MTLSRGASIPLSAKRPDSCDLGTHAAFREGLPGRAARNPEGLPEAVRLLAKNLTHPSLRAKKYDETADLWQARVNRDWRFYFLIEDDTYLIVAIVAHPK